MAAATGSTSVDAFKVTGLCAAPFTPCNDDGSVDFASIAAHVEELVRQGVKYAFVCGTTGEGQTLSVAERNAVVEEWLKASAGRVTIIAHVGAEAISDMIAMAEHAEKAGCAAIATHCTTFNKPHAVDAVVELLSRLSAAAPTLPLYYYHISVKTGVHNVRCDKLLEAIHGAPARVPTFRGIKYTDFDLHIYANCVAYAGGKYDILSGRDEVLLGALAMGCKGAVGSTYNYMGRVYNKLIAAFEAGDMATALALQRKSQQLVDLLNGGDKYGAGVNVGKAIMEMRLGDKHAGPPRYPGRAMEPAAKSVLRSDLEKLDFFDW